MKYVVLDSACYMAIKIFLDFTVVYFRLCSILNQNIEFNFQLSAILEVMESGPVDNVTSESLRGRKQHCRRQT